MTNSRDSETTMIKNQAAELNKAAQRVPGVKELLELHQQYADLIAKTQSTRKPIGEATTVICTPQ